MNKKTFISLCTCVVSLLFSASSFADRQGLDLGMGVSRFNFGDDIGLEDHNGFRAHLGYRFANPWGVELSYNRTTTEPAFSTTELDITHWYADALYHFNSGGSIEPYLALGYGMADADIVDGDTWDVGLGIKFYVSDQFIIRPDIHYADVDDFGDDHMISSLNLSWLIGASKSAPKKVVAAEPTPTDSDKDGVVNDMDQCPGTPMGAPVDSKGCPLDSDGDGVYDYQDKCPGTAAKLKVDATGCPVVLTDTVSINLKVNFDSNSDVVKPEYYPEIRKVAEFLEQYENTAAVIEGHTDTSGAAEYNKDLSQRRANAVAKVLTQEMGVAASRIKAVGYGEERTIADESTREGKLANRRVVAEISTSVESMQTK